MTMVKEVVRAVQGKWTRPGYLLTEKDWNDIARATIEAMREPTKAMIEAGIAADWVGDVESRAGDSIMPDEHGPGIWQAMIDAALKEEEDEVQV